VGLDQLQKRCADRVDTVLTNVEGWIFQPRRIAVLGARFAPPRI
jgi:hypothetical protein